MMDYKNQVVDLPEPGDNACVYIQHNGQIVGTLFIEIFNEGRVNLDVDVEWGVTETRTFQDGRREGYHAFIGSCTPNIEWDAQGGEDGS